MKSTTLLISSSPTKLPWILVGVFASIGLYNISPFPRSFSAPVISRIVLESIEEETANDTRVGIFDLITPVIISADGLWVATIKCIPAARASWVILIIDSSTSLAATNIKSASSSIITNINGILFKPQFGFFFNSLSTYSL